jgi:hypothetical protein
MKSSFLSKAIIVLAILFLAVPVSAALVNNKDTNRGLKIELGSVYYFAGSGELTSPVSADGLDSPDGYVLQGEGTISQMFITGSPSPAIPPIWTSEINILWANSVSTFAGGSCAPVDGTITDTFPDGSTLTTKVEGLATTMVSLTDGFAPLPCICYLSARIVKGTGQYEGKKGIAKITSYIDADGKITMIGEGTLKQVNNRKPAKIEQ